MRFLTNLFPRMEAWFARRTAVLAHARAPAIAAWTVPILFGLVSVVLGQDDNWDLLNYHWYNPYALLNGRLDLDMAPGQWQSYFNPLIDIPYYLLNTHLPGPLVGFLMGCVHGLNFVLLLAIARQLLGARPERDRLALLLAAAGTCGTGFLSQVGNTMGDNLTALLILGALLVVLRGWEHLTSWSGQAAGLMLLSGLLMGLGTGLKLTNAPYAVALCAALLVLPASWPQRFVLAFTQGLGVLAGIAITAGYWWITLWERFGNPLFPQFNNIFRSPLAQQLGVIDNHHMPQNALEALFWPFVFVVQWTRVTEIPLKMAMVALLYALALLFLARLLRERIDAPEAPAGRARRMVAPRARFLLAFALVGYLVWMKLFGIYRYLIPVELLAPLLAWLLIERLAAPGRGTRTGGWLLALATLVVFPFATWGHAGWSSWSEPAFSADVPAIARPADTIVFTAHGDPPMGWLATFYPREVRVIALAGGFPESPAWLARIQAALAERPGPHYLMLAVTGSEEEDSLRRKQGLADMLGLTGDAAGCARLEKLLGKVRVKADYQAVSAPGRQCTLAMQQRQADELRERRQALMLATHGHLARYGLALDESSCRIHAAAVGAGPRPFQFCRVNLAPKGRE